MELEEAMETPKSSFLNKLGRCAKPSVLTLALLLLVPLSLLCLGAGRLRIAPDRIVEILASHVMRDRSVQIPEATASQEEPAVDESVVLNVRLPRIIMALLLGAGLALAGVSFQGLFANPLATPDTLGVGAGASFGAVLGILVSQNPLVIQGLALLMGLGAMGITYAISRVRERRSMLMIVLSGIVTGAFFQALISLVKYVADPETKLPTITYWLLGSIADVTMQNVLLALPLLVCGSLVLILLRWRLNVLSLSDDEAASFGVNVRRMRWVIIAASTMITASAVSLCGQIGWVGLVVPHGARLLVGNDHRILVPMSAILGAAYLLLVDTLARSATSAEIPLSILTALVGAPFFAALLRRAKGGTWT